MLKLTPPDKRTEKLLDAISNFNTLSKEEQEQARPLLEETIERFKDVEQCHDIIVDFLANNEVKIEWKKRN